MFFYYAIIRYLSLYTVYVAAVLITGNVYAKSIPIYLGNYRNVVRTLSGPIFTPRAQTHPGNHVRPTDTIEAPISVLNAKDVKALADKKWNLDQCPPGIQVRMGNKVLSKKSFYCTKIDAVKLAPMLNDESITERAYVWCRTAFLYNSIEDKKTFDVEALNHFEGDITLSRENVDFVLGSYFPTQLLREASIGAAHDYVQKKTSRRRQKRKFSSRINIWNNAQIEFSIDDRFFDSTAKGVINEAISLWERQTCIRFIETNHERNFRPHLRFMKGLHGCASTIGRSSIGRNHIQLADGCVNVGTVAHELGHTLGFYHEQSRPDRDNYVTVVDDNVDRRYKEQFYKASWDSVFLYDIPYDYSSVMHYSSLAFTSNNKITLRTKDTDMQKVIGQREEISFLDVKLANVNYCSRSCGKLTLEWDRCKHEGYRNPISCSTCLCPRGFAPPFCEAPLSGKKVKCGEQILQASSARQTLRSPGYQGNGFPDNALCSYLIKTKGPGKQIKVSFSGRFHFTDDLDLCYDYVEVRHKQLYRAGPRFCGKQMPTQEFVSHGEEMMILIRTELPQEWQGFQINYQEEFCGSCSPDHGVDEPPCHRLVKYNCAPSDHEAYCYREEEYCCGELTKIENKCVAQDRVRKNLKTDSTIPTTVKPTTTARPTTRSPMTRKTTKRTTTTRRPTTRRPATRPPKTRPSTTTRPSIYRFITQRNGFNSWSRWTSWNACTATCGLCGNRFRSRVCLGSFCRGRRYEVQACGVAVCPFESVTRSKICRKLRNNRCPWYDFSCYQSYTCYELTTKPRCCVGTPINGRCTR